MTTLENAAAVLKLFSRQHMTHGQPGISFSDVVQQLALPKSTVSRLLQTMENQGMLERDAQNRMYKIGRLLLTVSSHYLSTPMVDNAAAGMVQLSGLTSCTGYISMLDGSEIVVMRVFPGRHFLQVVTPVGSRSPAAETSVGRALLAREDDAQVAERFAAGYRVASPNAPQTLAALLQKLAQIRQQGWSLARNETLQGISSLATTVTNKHRSETVGLCLSFPTQSVEQPFAAEVLLELMTVSRQLAEKLGDDYWRQIP
ncbi:IclR family transcriptional regulator [Serratia odorifera]|jgi:IclR family transcriptional regulator, KDG regulon repressor|uniref:IclR helix-turn-helix domain protein n=2 Tax=Serratia odorifera TaxID=618 RepID=D4DWF6_SEROD|nr:IclR family transcriptional regulator [Serratia odorifera]EFE98211.1 IclR helix-turn-helix domain protein [Serratia odorifera DSM 4582]PNK92517.1 IclR family transcriptional regulator [Serratia odorifera]RII73791.1 IclR family transcriptional regulator [Serratia odorifera]VDZ51966.1 Transcriptional regulator kdgR [Serratia odorifera]HEJ9095590.1 IclR family transcriptional regulator [Serratia odorifera]